MKRYLLDTTPLVAYLKGVPSARELVEPWIRRREAATSILVYGEVMEYYKSFVDLATRQAELQTLLREVSPYVPTYGIRDRYADIRRQLRPPHGPGLVGDIDTLIAATAFEHDLIVVTTDSDYSRVAGLRLQLMPRKM